MNSGQTTWLRIFGGGYGRGKSIMGELLNKRIYLIKDINETDIAPKKMTGEQLV
ncbi:MAG: hypothetical protein IPG53_21255 [Ignavibacteriales bacterium]|nr:hypothetical protein [Ignavibacteriales bacterium]